MSYEVPLNWDMIDQFIPDTFLLYTKYSDLPDTMQGAPKQL